MRHILDFTEETAKLKEIIGLCNKELKMNSHELGLGVGRTLESIIGSIVDAAVVLKKNSHGVFTINGRDPEPNETMWWDFEKIPRTIIRIVDNPKTEMSIYKEGGNNYCIIFDMEKKELLSISLHTEDFNYTELKEVTFDKYESHLINYYRVTEERFPSVTFRRNETGKFTVDGRNVVAKWNYLYFDGVTLGGHSDKNNVCYAFYNERKMGNFIFTFTKDTSELISIRNADNAENIVELSVYCNSSIFRNYKELGPLNMTKVVPYTKLELHVSGLAVNSKPIIPSRNYEWRVKSVNEMEVLLNGDIDVKVPEATPPVTITIDKFGKIQKIKDTNDDSRLEVQIPNDSEFLKHLYIIKEVAHSEYIKE